MRRLVFTAFPVVAFAVALVILMGMRDEYCKQRLIRQHQPGHRRHEARTRFQLDARASGLSCAASNAGPHRHTASALRFALAPAGTPPRLHPQYAPRRLR